MQPFWFWVSENSQNIRASDSSSPSPPSRIQRFGYLLCRVREKDRALVNPKTDHRIRNWKSERERERSSWLNEMREEGLITRRRQRRWGPSRVGGILGAEVEEEQGAATVPRKLPSLPFRPSEFSPATPNPSKTHVCRQRRRRRHSSLSLSLLLFSFEEEEKKEPGLFGLFFSLLLQVRGIRKG